MPELEQKIKSEILTLIKNGNHVDFNEQTRLAVFIYPIKDLLDMHTDEEVQEYSILKTTIMRIFRYLKSIGTIEDFQINEEIFTENSQYSEASFTVKIKKESKSEFTPSGKGICLNNGLWLLDHSGLYYKENDQMDFNKNSKIEFTHSEYRTIEWLYTNRMSLNKPIARELADKLKIKERTLINSFQNIKKKTKILGIGNLILNNKTVSNTKGNGYYLNTEYL